MDPSRPNLPPYFPNTPATPSTQPPLVYPMTPMDPYSFGGFSQSQNLWQVQYRHHLSIQMHSQPSQMPPLQPLNQTKPKHDFISLGVDDDVIYPKPNHKPRRPRKENKRAQGGKQEQTQEEGSGNAQSIPWSADELEALAQAWVNVSTDPIKGTNRKRDGFWKQVCKEFFQLIQRPPYRLVHSVSSKYR
ncbi:hypothetical protein HanHA300_Chr03g0083061 [Helianthus annuus]|nr:hypothetical protein HanHA300_Chr03g0083061 [Helianthus annuus]KAJ0607259.1 hypothetical protein HanHA89_Chr03g0094561 [Helianthus annuus]KAJ0767319.1 hypothetical protein HanLR1_Chr03g0087861 [Helianthus annuus]KAJ0773162.1 hypothetical protein HanOQP8_Chr03g0095861 [Helianthus annuus]